MGQRAGSAEQIDDEGAGRQNRLTMRELVGELRDEGDEGAGRRATEKIKLRKKEERREAGEREREREREYFNERGERSVIIFFFFLSFELQCTSKDRCAL